MKKNYLQKIVESPFSSIFLLTLISVLSSCSHNRPAEKRTPSQSQSVLNEEYISADEEAQFKELALRVRRVQLEQSIDNKKPVVRGTHPKSHACFKAQLTIDSNIPLELRQGIAAQEQTYEALVRFANAWPYQRSDKLPDIHGMSVKVFGVSGPRLNPDEESDSQDFLANDIPYSITPDAATLVALTEASAKGDVEVAKFLAQNPRVAQTFLKEGMRRGIRSLRAPLDGLDYFSGTPFLWGNRAAKFIWRPCGQRREQVDPYYVNTFGENFLSKDIVQQVATKGICFNFFVQLQTDPEAHPIEDSSVNWDEVLSVPQKVGTLQIPRQLGHSKSMKAKCEISKFNPWNGLESHRPLGNTNRARKLIYAGSRKQRGL